MTAAVARVPGSELEIVELDLDEPRSDELLVRLVATGICHTDLMARDSPAPMELPAVLGHEGSGIVEQVGSAVRGLAVGDKVVLTWDSCGACRHCLAGSPAYCAESTLLNRSGRRADFSTSLSESGRPVCGHFFQQSSFATHALAHPRNAIKLPDDTSLERLRLLGPLGCGVQTGAGAILTAFDARPGSSVAVWGAGSVGLSAVMAAASRGCDPIVAMDIKAERLTSARTFGATHTLDADADDIVDQVVAISGGVDYAVETTGIARVVSAATRSLGIGGHLGLHSRARLGPGGMDIAQMPPGRTVSFLIEGQCVPQLLIPELLGLHQRGSLPFDQMMTMYAFEDINQAIADMSSGKTIKPILVF
ncbi:NAD(P)-dependent alcohol dehydrogenase [Mycobacterium aquaticum]|uniref:NAD(P)-dependent alcohol dehydrogenase n=1 Tax=Mycobacterium aquaticum TaxID=1927124 RepID=UPI001B80B302|nr:NAD(P)-dependent alcohol dehydrogenase [Mycobacterium aquaticum]